MSSVNKTLHSVWDGVRSNKKLHFIAMLVFVFPLFFILILQSFLHTAQANIETTQRQSISLLHDNLAYSVMHQVPLSPLLATLTKENPDISDAYVVTLTDEGFVVSAAADLTTVNTIDPDQELLRSLPATADTLSVVLENTATKTRVWEAFRKVETDDASYVVITKHTFGASDTVLLAREQQAYIGLSAIFFFLIALAYWVWKQTNWEAAYHRLHTTLQERDSFVHMVAHEFRTPLTAIKGYASLLEESNDLSGEEKRYTENIKISSERLVRLVNDFLEVARIQANKLNLKNELVDIGTLITNVCSELRPLAQERSLPIVYHQQQTAIKLYTDPVRLRQILTIVVTNAIQNTIEGEVEVTAVQHPHKLVLIVTDTSKGMSAADQQHLFTQFTRVGGSNVGDGIESGLGMWITKQLVEALGGTIAVQSTENIGTHVSMTFPH